MADYAMKTGKLLLLGIFGVLLALFASDAMRFVWAKCTGKTYVEYTDSWLIHPLFKLIDD